MLVAVHKVYTCGQRAGTLHRRPLVTFDAPDMETAELIFNRDHRPRIERRGKEISCIEFTEISDRADNLLEMLG